MKRIFLISIYFMFVAIPINIQAKALHYIPTPEQLQPPPVNVAPDISHNVNYESPSNPFVDYGSGSAAGQPAAAAGQADAKNASGKAVPASQFQGNGAANFWTVALLLFSAVLACVLIILKKRDDKK